MFFEQPALRNDDVICRHDAGLLEKCFNDRAAAVGEKLPNAGISFKRCAAIPVDIEREKFWIVAWREAVGGIDFAPIEHDIECLR